jgi:hypothetical protein
LFHPQKPSSLQNLIYIRRGPLEFNCMFLCTCVDTPEGNM